MSYVIYRTQPTGLAVKSIFVVVLQTGAYRQFEATNVPLAAVDADYIAATYTEAQMWSAGTALTLVQGYIAAHLAYRSIFATAWYTHDSGIQTIPSFTLANYQAVLTATLNVINTLPAPFLDNLSHERTGQSLTMAVSSMTLAQCAAFDNLLRSWINTRLVGAMIAGNLPWWTT